MIRQWLNWYWWNVKYRKYAPQERKFLCTFEQGIRARQEVDSTVYVLLRLNIERAKCIFENDFESLKEVEEQIGTLGKEYESDMKDMDKMDGYIWRKMFTYFLATHDNETTSKVWGAPMADILKFREAVEKLAPKTEGR
jgi:hypothetical protein